MTKSSALNATERRCALALAAVFFLRMLGLFILIPVLALYVTELEGATPLLIGLAIGGYGLTQALLQIPLGALSDRIGRQPVIVGGLLVFVAGAGIAAVSGSIWPVVAGRAIQGLGAVSGATLALAADLSREEQRTKIMALIGVSIGAAFSAAFVLGPALDALIGLRGLFLTSGGLALCAIPIVMFVVPHVPRTARAPQPGSVMLTLRAPNLRVLYAGVLSLHLILAASFVAVPLAILQGLGITSELHYRVYLPVLLASLIVVGPLVMMSTRGAWTRVMFYAAIALLALAEALIHLGWHDPFGLYAALTLFFIAFNYLEASLPGLISRAAPSDSKGTALGAYSTFQFIGVFIGGLFGGLVAGQFGYLAVPLGCSVLALLWLLYTLRLPAAALIKTTP